MNDKEWTEFLNLLKDVENGKETGPFAPIGTKKLVNPKTWEDLIARINDLPGDDPITWLPLSKLSLNEKQ